MRPSPAHILPLLLVATACGAPEAPVPEVGPPDLLTSGPAIVDDPAVRREILEASLVDPSNGYGRARLDNYGLGDRGWDTLPVRNFPVRPATTRDLGAFERDPLVRSTGDFEPIFDAGGFEWTRDALLTLGRRAFREYPLDVDVTYAAAYESRSTAEELGLWESEDRLGGYVRVRLPDGSESFASTCSACHSSVVDGELMDGRVNASLDRDAITRRFHGGRGSGWGPGRVDVTADGVSNPVAITDLRPIRYQRRLHWAATLYNSPEALAVRVETLMITSANKSMRPPREVAVALAYYLWSLGEESVGPLDEDGPGAELFDANCSSCHGLDGSTAEPVAIDAIGTDPAVGLSSERGTGFYRVPSLYRVGSRSQFLHEGKVKSLEAMFDPARLDTVPGHTYGTDLSPEQRTELIEFLRAL